MGILGRLRMQYRITISVAIALTVILAAFAYLAISSVGESEDAAKRERLVWAKAMAVHVDDVLTRALVREGHLATMAASAWSEDEEVLAEVLSGISPEFMFRAELYLIDPSGRPVWANHLPGDDNDDVLSEPAVAAALASSQGQIGQCQVGVSGTPRACLASPVMGPAGDTMGLLLARVDLTESSLNLVPSPQLGRSAHAELLRGGSTVLAADIPSLAGSSPHTEALARFVASNQPGATIHDPSGDAKSHILAYAPISTVPGWGVAVEQEEDVALAVAGDLQQRFLLFGILAVLLAAGLAWVDVRQVVKPLGVLTSRAEKMAAGDLDTPITSSRKDEVGTLARSFESMRGRLKASLEQIEHRDRELEQRVLERTREVQELLGELQRKEEIRSRLLEKVISAQEEERKRIARELHDETGQAITGVVMSLEAAEDALNREPEAARQRLERARSLAAHSIEGIRHLVVDLRPAALDDLGLVPALRAFAENRLGEKGIRLELETSGLKDRLSPPVETCIFRVVQEAVTNIVRHSQAKSTRIRLWRQNGSVSLLVEDDGQGFDSAEVMNSPDSSRALGLLGMEERVSLVGGHLKVESAPGGGTRIEARIPVREEDSGGG